MRLRGVAPGILKWSSAVTCVLIVTAWATSIRPFSYGSNARLNIGSFRCDIVRGVIVMDWPPNTGEPPYWPTSPFDFHYHWVWHQHGLMWPQVHSAGGYGAHVIAPLWCVLAPIAWFTAFAWRRHFRQRTSLGHCPRCRYNLTGNITSVCPD